MTAVATDHFGTSSAMTPLTTTANPLVVDTAGPRITSLVYNKHTGMITVTVQGGAAGLDQSTLTNLANYIVNGPRIRHSSEVGIASVTTTAATAGQPQVIQIQLSNFKKLQGRPFQLDRRFRGLSDRAGNAGSMGEFLGTFPLTGDGHPGGLTFLLASPSLASVATADDSVTIHSNLRTLRGGT